MRLALRRNFLLALTALLLTIHTASAQHSLFADKEVSEPTRGQVCLVGSTPEVMMPSLEPAQVSAPVTQLLPHLVNELHLQPHQALALRRMLVPISSTDTVEGDDTVPVDAAEVVRLAAEVVRLLLTDHQYDRLQELLAARSSAPRFIVLSR